MLKQTPEQTYIFALFASVSEVVRRVAPPHQTLLATTWEANHAGMIGDLRVHRIQETVIELTDQFLADYRAANRPGQTFSPELLPEKNTKK